MQLLLFMTFHARTIARFHTRYDWSFNKVNKIMEFTFYVCVCATFPNIPSFICKNIILSWCSLIMHMLMSLCVCVTCVPFKTKTGIDYCFWLMMAYDACNAHLFVCVCVSLYEHVVIIIQFMMMWWMLIENIH